MKIAYYLPSLYISGGIERIITLKANYFAEQFGYETVIITSEQQGRQPYFPLSEKVTHVDLNVVIDHAKGPLLRKIIIYPFKYYRFKKRFTRLLDQLKPDITISTLRRELRFINSLKDGSIKIGEFHVNRINSSWHQTNTDNPVLRRISNRNYARFVKNLQSLTKVVLLTREESTYWAELSNYVVIPNFITIPPLLETSSCTQRRVIAVGRATRQKGFDLLIDAWKIVASKHPDWTLNIYGEGDKTQYQRQIAAHHIEDSCHLRSAVADIAEKYAESSIFVLSSRYEGFGLVLIEAMACGVPPVAFDCPCGPKEIIQDGSDGLLVKTGNIEELAEKICYLMENEDVRKKMGQQSATNVSRYRIDRVSRQWKELFESLLER
ncbi:MAG: glycosyltransferase family 4 protein [Bacteroidales bacterium]|nr:glycosyltransferase family 4 protein [Bacteroidales bacterium]